MDDRPKTSRRSMLKGSAMLVVGAALASRMAASRQAFAQQKMAQSAVQYQNKPNGDKKCSNCLQFVPGSSPTANGTCKLVDGSISPQGYCTLWAAKPS